jgi:MSHA biogenesis protein MshL
MAAIDTALLPPLVIPLPKANSVEPKFDLIVNNAPAAQVFMGIVSGTRYNMLIPPDLTGNISVDLKNMTVPEALSAIRELYGYDYRIENNSIFIQPMTMQTHIFKVNYIAGQRQGSSDTRVTSGSVSDTPSSGMPNGMPNAVPTNTPDSGGQTVQTSKITTRSKSDFWQDLSTSLALIIGDKDGRKVVVNSESGVILVHALPNEIHQIENYLGAMQLSIDRQVMLEAKIIEVQLGNQSQTGINWAALNRYGQSRFSVGADPGTLSVPGPNLPGGVFNTATLGAAASASGVTSASPYATVPGSLAGTTLGSLFGAGMPNAISTTAGALNVTAQGSNFAAMLDFLSTQGKTKVLSSPRIATLNNQMAILKVGTDDFFVTNVTSTVTGVSTTTTAATPNVTLRPFFSGIALDVMPEISEEGQITLHIHPSVSQVVTKNSVINLGASLGTLTLPLASSTVSETDSVVRVESGSIVAIGGLMQETSIDDNNEVPGVGDVPGVGALFKHTNRVLQKNELVILLKTTIIKGDSDWTQDVLQVGDTHHVP